ncbi:hypothetical protein QBC43DRAFT_318676 [Cladorrhinum sp. PSN259]|nr:hypothetical protein QBC43DRAFT_318676 [Cladorrhinum sp. PSN259]
MSSPDPEIESMDSWASSSTSRIKLSERVHVVLPPEQPLGHQNKANSSSRRGIIQSEAKLENSARRLQGHERIQSPLSSNRRANAAPNTSPTSTTTQRQSDEPEVVTTAFGIDQTAIDAQLLHSIKTGELDIKAYRSHHGIAQTLDPIMQSTPCLLICDGELGPEHLSHVIPVPLGRNLELCDYVEIWKRIQRTWYKNRGRWRKWLLPFYGVKSMEPVEIRLVGRFASDRDTMRGILSSVKAKVKQEIESLDEKNVEHNGGFYPLDDSRDSARYQYYPHANAYSHSKLCIDESHRLGGCAFTDQTKRLQRRFLLQLMITFPVHLFHQPELANGNNIIPGAYYYTTHDVCYHLNSLYAPSVGDLNLQGFRLEEGLLFNPLRSRRVLSFLGVNFLLVLIAAWYLYGDWATAWTAVGSIATIMTVWIACQVASH